MVVLTWSQALEAMFQGHRVTRDGLGDGSCRWIGRGIGNRLRIRAVGTTSWEIWDPTLGDFLAEDWAIVEGA